MNHRRFGFSSLCGLGSPGREWFPSCVNGSSITRQYVSRRLIEPSAMGFPSRHGLGSPGREWLCAPARPFRLIAGLSRGSGGRSRGFPASWAFQPCRSFPPVARYLREGYPLGVDVRVWSEGFSLRQSAQRARMGLGRGIASRPAARKRFRARAHARTRTLVHELACKRLY